MSQMIASLVMMINLWPVYPKTELRKPAKTANRGKVAILTSTPYVDELNDSIQAKRCKLPTSKLPSLKGNGLS